MKKLLYHPEWGIVCLSVAILFFSGNGSYEGGDIGAARRSYLGENPIDIWGAFSGFFYSLLPNSLLPWGLWLLIIQISATSAGLILIFRSIKITNTADSLAFFTLAYVILSFTGYLTRDSTLASLYIFGVGLIFMSINRRNYLNHIYFYTGILFIVLSMAFRPWLGFAAVFPILYLSKNRLKLIFLTFILIVLPFSLDRLSYLTNNFNSVHPEFQVVISDLSAMACLSSNQITRERGVFLLNEFDKTSYTNSEICNDYRINTWQGLGRWSVKSSELGSDARLDGNQATSKIPISSDLTDLQVSKIRDAWFNFIFDHPKEYIQVKLIHAVQIGFAGDSWGLRIFTAENFKDQIAGLLFIPFDLLISLHLLSPLMTLLFGTLIICVKLKKFSLVSILKNRDIAFAFLFLTMWLLFSAVAYIGDNGRYTYFSSFIFYILILKGSNELKIRAGQGTKVKMKLN
jgi:hypothetical protein